MRFLCKINDEVESWHGSMLLTLPTARSHPKLMHSLIRDSDPPMENTHVVVTRKGVELPPGVVAIEDLDAPNI